MSKPQEIKTATREQVDKLKADWLADRSWDIADTDAEEFAPYFEELQEFQSVEDKKLKDIINGETIQLCKDIGCSPGLLEYLRSLENSLEELQSQVYQLRSDIQKLGG